MDRDKQIGILKIKDIDDLIIVDGSEEIDSVALNYEALADHLIANGIGDITTEKHRANVAAEALRLAIKRADISYFKCNYTKLCNFRTYECGSKECINIIMEAYKQEAEERLRGEL